MGVVEGVRSAVGGRVPDAESRWPVAAEALEQAMLEGKDKDQLLAIAQALGIKTNARAAKATLIAKILETTGAGSATAPASGGGKDAAAEEEASSDTDANSLAEPATEVVLGPDGEPLADWEIDLVRSGEIEPMSTPAGRAAADDDDEDDDDGDDDGPAQGESRNARRRRRRRNKNRSTDADGEPNGGASNGQQDRQQGSQQHDRQRDGSQRDGGQRDGGKDGGKPFRNERERHDSTPELVNHEPVEVSGYLDLRDEGYGFLRVAGYLPSRDDAYIPVKLTDRKSTRLNSSH